MNKPIANIIMLILTLSIISSCAKALKIAVTVPSIECDVKSITRNDTVLSIVPPNVDIHSYQLRPSDVEELRSSDVIISTAHTPFEIRIRELVRSGEISAKLIEIPKINGIRFFKYPGTNVTNFHMPVYDPENYKVFIKFVAEFLYDISGNKDYVKNAEEVCKRIDELVKKTKKLNMTAAADLPFAQYAVSWLNVSVKYIVLKEPELPILPRDLEKIENSMKNGEIDLVVLCRQDTKASEILKDLAHRYGLPVLYVDSPTSLSGIAEKLENISMEADRLEVEESPGFEILIFLAALLIVFGLRGARGCFPTT